MQASQATLYNLYQLVDGAEISSLSHPITLGDFYARLRRNRRWATSCLDYPGYEYDAVVYRVRYYLWGRESELYVLREVK